MMFDSHNKKIIFCIRKISTNFIRQISQSISRMNIKKQNERIAKKNKLLEAILKAHTKYHIARNGNTGHCIIFSMDRALQLHALLSSYYEKVSHPVPLHVLWRASSEEHRRAYGEVLNLFAGRNISPVYQETRGEFKKILLAILSRASEDKVFFLVDDIVFINDTDMNDFLSIDAHNTVGSLRLGQNLTKAYTVQKKQRLPFFLENDAPDEKRLTWIWEDGELDWGYPLSVDGNLFLTAEISALAEHISFHSPNTFESALQPYVKYYAYRRGMCYSAPKILNIPVNRVQRDFDNIYGQYHQDDLLKAWNDGFQMDYRKLYGFINESVHQEVEISLIKRKN